MNSVQIGPKSYETPPRKGFTVAYFLTVADIARSLRFYETVFGGRILSGGDSKAVAVFMSVSGRYADAERLAERAVLILEKAYSPNDLVLLRPLQTLVASRFEQGKTAKARESFKRIQAIRIQRPEDGALVHGIAAALLQADGNL